MAADLELAEIYKKRWPKAKVTEILDALLDTQGDDFRLISETLAGHGFTFQPKSAAEVRNMILTMQAALEMIEGTHQAADESYGHSFRHSSRVMST